ncbi:MAG: MFS transporter [Planctomycetes bacterium]|nr:MFS transporter [Planctomycetota bacterium]
MPDSVPISPPPLETGEHTARAPEVGYLEKTLPVPAASWVLYDLANTVYVATLTFIFVPYLAELFESRGLVGIVSSASMVCAGMLVPLFAAAGDRTGRCRTYLIVATMACIIPMALFGASTALVPLMIAFFVANLAYNGSLVFYNALLPSVAADRNQGLVSGLGVGLGYVGTLVTLIVVLPLQESIGPRATFYLTAGMFLLFALPSFVFVKERRVLVSERFSLKLVKSSFGAVIKTLKSLPKNRSVMWFLLGNFFCVDVLNTAILFFGDLTRTSFAPSINAGEAKIFGHVIESEVGLLMLAGLTLNGLALVFGITLGFLTDKLGSLRMLRFSAACLVLGLLGAAFAAGETVLGYLIGICGFGGLGLSGIWTAGRKLLIELSPREKVGEYFGLYGITTKLSVIGSAVVGVLQDVVSKQTGSDLTGWKVAIGAQAGPLLLGILFLALVKKPQPGPASATS